jgi:predicted transcriptional regulator of viral defense system
MSDLPKGRVRLAEVLQSAGDLVTVDDVCAILGADRPTAARQLARWHVQGWLRRVRRGTYAAVPVSALGQEQVLTDPWILVPQLFSPAYIGGWSAAEHWGLTEQIFRDICVLTTRRLTRTRETIQGVPFVLKHVRERALFGTRAVWRGSIRVQVSTPAKTLVDMLDDPALGGGIRHVRDCLDALLRDDVSAPAALLADARQLGNGAVFKRLGFLAEQRGGPTELVDGCAAHLTTGNAVLDPALPAERLTSRWRLWHPAGWRVEHGA